MSEQRETTLYRLYDENKRLLYVGVGYNATSRLNSHSHEKPWWPRVRLTTFSKPFPTRALAEAAEKHAIKTERPVFNKIHAQPTLAARKKAGELTWTCDECGEGIARRKGFIQYVDGFWQAHHKTCDPYRDVDGVYWFGVERIHTAAELQEWTQHLAQKNWFWIYDWNIFLKRRMRGAPCPSIN